VTIASLAAQRVAGTEFGSASGRAWKTVIDLDRYDRPLPLRRLQQWQVRHTFAPVDIPDAAVPERLSCCSRRFLLPDIVVDQLWVCHRAVSVHNRARTECKR